MKTRRQNDLELMPSIPGVPEVIDQCLEIAASVPTGDTAGALAEIDKVFKAEKLCDCQPGQCTKEPKYCKDWNK